MARTVTLGVTDADSANNNDTQVVNVSAVNDAPTVTTTGSALAYTENDPATVIDAGLTVSDPDNANLDSVIVRITNNFTSGQDVLAFSNQLGITGSWNAGTGILTLSGSTTVANYQAALRTVTYQNTSDNPNTATRTISFFADDGIDSGTAATRNINITAVNDDPINTGSVPTDVTVIEDTPGFIDLASINFADVDAGTNLIQVTLTTSTGGRLTASSDFDVMVFGSGTGTLTLRGGVADLNNFFSSAFRFQYSHGTAHMAGDNADNITITVNDLGNTGSGGGGNINLGTVNVDITPVNDRPAGADNTVSAVEDTDYVFLATDFGFSDPDGPSS